MKHPFAGALLALLAALSSGCVDEPEAPEYDLPDPKYLYSESDVLPSGATGITPEEFSELFKSGELQLAGPVALAEAKDRELKLDQEDGATIAQYQAANPNAPKMLREVVMAKDGTVESTPDGNFLIKVPNESGTGFNTHITMGARFRLRTLAKAIKQYNTLDNQLALYRQAIDGLPKAVKEQLNLDTFENVSKLTMEQVKVINGNIAMNWKWIVPTIPQVEGPIIQLPLSRDDVGYGNNGDIWSRGGLCPMTGAGGIVKNFGSTGI